MQLARLEQCEHSCQGCSYYAGDSPVTPLLHSLSALIANFYNLTTATNYTEPLFPSTELLLVYHYINFYISATTFDRPTVQSTLSMHRVFKL